MNMDQAGFPEYTAAEQAADRAVHLIGLTMAPVAALWLLSRAALLIGASAAVAVAVYGVGLIAMIGASAAYNLTPAGALKGRLRRLDHAMIFVMIAGSYTPFATVGKCGGRLLAAASCSAPQRVSDDYLGALDDLSKTHDLPFYVHILETRTQRVLGDLRGRSLVRDFSARGALSERCNVIHAIWMDDADYDLIAEAGASVAHNPISNLRLGSGVMPFRRLQERGINIALGTDEAIADDSVNMWGVAKMAGLIHNIADPDYARWPSAAEVLTCLFTGGARAMRQEARIGAVAPGLQADLIMLDLDTLAFTPLNDLDRQLVYCENGSSVRLTMVAGAIVARNGCVLTIDEAALRAEARSLAAQLAGAGQTEAAAAPYLPYYRDMYLRAAAADLGMLRAVPHKDRSPSC